MGSGDCGCWPNKSPLPLAGAEGLGAVRAGANTAEVIVAEDAGRVAVGKRDLNGVVASRGRRVCARLRLEHRQRGGRSGYSVGDSAFSYPLIIAGGAGTLFEIGRASCRERV